MAEELTGSELDRAVATALGIDLSANCCTKRGGDHTVEEHYGAPEYHLSLDLLFAPGGPVERLRAEGFTLTLKDAPTIGKWIATARHDEREGDWWHRQGSPAEAVCRALLAAVPAASSDQEEGE